MEIINKLEKNRLLAALISRLSNLLLYFIRSVIPATNSNTLVIISLHKLGDTVFTIPAIRRLIAINKDKRIVIFAFSDSIEIYKLAIENVDFKELNSKHFIFGNRISKPSARKSLKQEKPGEIYDLTGNIASASLILFSRAKLVGMSSKYFKAMYDIYIPIRNKPHLVDRYLDIANLAYPKNIEDRDAVFPVFLQSHKKILIHPFAGWHAKEWGLRNYIQLALQLSKDYEVEIIAPSKIIPDDIICEIHAQKIGICFTSTINELITEIKKCFVLISNDSGPIQIASLLGKPTFSIYGPTNPTFSVPLGKQHKFVNKNLKCSPKDSQYCFTHAGLYCPSNECMKIVDVKYVYTAFMNFVKELENQNA
ncbi:MAG: glycosyltransferase family 9 protein [Ignavibacteriaceae bacterium]|nr:glycosyltransferase family 9 protein [Ignavibacteriaceae bacterium]